MGRRVPRVLIGLFVLALALTPSVYIAFTTGMMESLYEGGATEGLLHDQRRVHRFDPAAVGAQSNRDRPAVRWTGLWYVPGDGLHHLFLESDGDIAWRIDGYEAHSVSAGAPSPEPRTVLLRRGFHKVEIDYRSGGAVPSVTVAWATGGGAQSPLLPGFVLPAAPVLPWISARLFDAQRLVRPMTIAGALSVLLIVLVRFASWVAARAILAWGEASVKRVRRASALALITMCVAYAGGLRLDAITMRYGEVTSPAWIRAFQRYSAAPLRMIRPDGVTWEPVGLHPHRDGPPTHYASDPYTYLEFGRSMRSFYSAHYREPVFPFATRTFLTLFDNQDVAVSFASATFSLLTVIGVYLLGSLAFSNGIGLAAALLTAIEYDLVSSGTLGWRDDAFMCFVVLSTYAALRYSREPTSANALLLGVCAALSCLVRLTSLSFLVPGFLAAALVSRHPWRPVIRGLGLAALVAAVLVGPYLYNCWRVFGDPLYAINYHVTNFQLTEGTDPPSSPPDARSGAVGGDTTRSAGPSARSFFFERARRRPFQTIDSVALGMTTYPFEIKWKGFDQWVRSSGLVLSWAALAGLLLFAGSRAGFMLLVVLSTSLFPFSLTWELWPDWRFTQHAYPFFLIAACAAFGIAVSWTRPGHRAAASLTDRLWTPGFARWLLVLGAVGAATWVIARGLPVWTAREALSAGEAVTFGSVGRQRVFAAEGWSEPYIGGSVAARVARGPYSVLLVPLPRVADYDVTLRLDPFPAPRAALPSALPRVSVFANGTLVTRLDLSWNPERVGAFRFILPRSALSTGMNRIALVTERSMPRGTWEPGLPDASTFRFWYLRVRPPEAQAP